jgi:hypothetical protein
MSLAMSAVAVPDAGESETQLLPKWQTRTGLVLSGVVSMLLMMDASMKVMQVPEAIQGTRQLGYPVGMIVPLGLIQLVCLALYIIPRSAVFGAILWTGYFGGAVATHVRLGNPWATHILSPVYVAIFLWGSLWLRDARVRAILPFRRN